MRSARLAVSWCARPGARKSLIDGIYSAGYEAGAHEFATQLEELRAQLRRLAGIDDDEAAV
jgi:hypothetical protein